MPVYLVAQGFELNLELDLAPAVVLVLELQSQRLGRRDCREAFGRRISDEFNRVIPHIVDSDLLGPTPGQMAYAIELAKAQREEVPLSAIRSRTAMQLYIESRLAHADRHSPLSEGPEG
ncbi:hypothetical protein KR767_06670 [Luteibacter anthropi]|uniref:hypothetical protein n=1 Tax=Luteibacter anthropi TaxID=564369 RepID=UPI0020321935|nr:hypothetical protein [Luteibacter anthropi]URX63732.1 hypothetical protein KR767_06670 [Luteibacter anthropi]